MNPVAGARVRICQALVLPHLQGTGIGRELLLSAYRLAASRGDVTQLTVESPCEAFSRLRDRCDLEWALTRNAFPAHCHSLVTGRATALPAASFPTLAWDAASIKNTATCAMMTPAQARFLHEVIVYAATMQEYPCEGTDARDTAVAGLKEYRLAAKRRLLQEPENVELRSLDKKSLKIELSTLYDELVERIQHVLRAARRI